MGNSGRRGLGGSVGVNQVLESSNHTPRNPVGDAASTSSPCCATLTRTLKAKRAILIPAEKLDLASLWMSVIPLVALYASLFQITSETYILPPKRIRALKGSIMASECRKYDFEPCETIGTRFEHTIYRFRCIECHWTDETYEMYVEIMSSN